MGCGNFDRRCYACVCHLNIHAFEELSQAHVTTVSNVLLLPKGLDGNRGVERAFTRDCNRSILTDRPVTPEPRAAASERYLRGMGPMSYYLGFLLRMLIVSPH